jgi:hypothetical protein
VADGRGGVVVDRRMPRWSELRELLHHEGAPLSTEQLKFASLRSWGGTVAELADWIFDPAASLADVRALRDAGRASW